MIRATTILTRTEAGRRYVALETECACLVLLRDINEPSAFT